MSNAEKETESVKRDAHRRWRLAIVPSMAVGALAFALIDLCIFTGKGPTNPSRDISGIAAPAGVNFATSQDPLWPLIKEVAEHFLCGCGECGHMHLVECDCGMSTGGISEKQFIREQLVAGHSKDEVITLVLNRFGHRMPTPSELDTLNSEKAESRGSPES